MVCEKCEKKLGKVITPDPWKSGARNTTESGGRKVGENKALTATKSRFNPYTSKFETCRFVFICILETLACLHVVFVQDMSTKGTSSGITLLPVMCI